MSKNLKIFIAGLLLVATSLTYMLTRPSTPPSLDGSASVAKIEQSPAPLPAKAELALASLPAKEAAEIRALLTSTGARRYDDRAYAWNKAVIKDNLGPVAEFAVANLRAMAEAGDPKAMWFLHFTLSQRAATADEGLSWLKKSADGGYPRAIFDLTFMDKEVDARSVFHGVDIVDQPKAVLKAMQGFASREDEAGLQALYWFASGYEKGQHGLPQDAAKATDYRNRAKALGDKLQAAATAK
jgi:hypothetical protein